MRHCNSVLQFPSEQIDDNLVWDVFYCLNTHEYDKLIVLFTCQVTKTTATKTGFKNMES